MLDTVYVYKESVEIFGMQYRAFLTSARTEMTLMAKGFNSRVISRIGFTTDEIRDLHDGVIGEIETRAGEIGGNETACIVQALAEVETALNDAGGAIQSTAMKVSEDLNTLNEMAVYPLLSDLDFMTKQFDIEILSIFSRFNAVTGMFSILIELESEIRFYGALFDYYVSYIFVEMIIYEILADEISIIAFPQLQEAVDNFRSSAEAVRESLVACV